MATVVSHQKRQQALPALPTTEGVAKRVDPSQTSGVYAKQAEDWTLIRDCLGGTRVLREKHTDYLPQHFREHDDNYADRVARATFLNVVEDAIENVVAHPFEKEFTLTEDSHPAALVLATDINAQGDSLHTFGRQAFFDGIADGQVHFLVEHSAVPAGATLADEIAAGARPYLVEVPAQKLIAAYTEMRRGEKIVTHARILEEKVVRRGFEEHTLNCVRVYEVTDGICTWELWQQGDIDKPANAEWHVIDNGVLQIAPGVAWDRVPLYSWYPGKVRGDFDAKPPFLDLAHKNLQHYRVESDYDNIERQTCYPMLGVRPPAEGGISSINVLNPGTDEAGDRSTFQPGPDAILVGDYYYCQPDAGVFTSIQTRLDNLIDEMKGLALDPVSNKRPGDATATEKSIEATQAKSLLHEWAISFREVIREAIEGMLYWVGEEDATVECVINTDFKVTMTDMTGSTLMQYFMAGIISRHTVWEESKRKGILGPTFDPEKEPQRIADEAPEFAAEEDLEPTVPGKQTGRMTNAVGNV